MESDTEASKFHLSAKLNYLSHFDSAPRIM